MSMKKKNLDAHLAEIFKEFIQLKDNDLKKSQEVFNDVFEVVKKAMGEQDNYFQKYSTQVLYGGSVADGIKVSRLDEFDMDIIIRLPISYDHDIILESDKPGFVKMLITNAFDHLDKQQDWEKCHKVTREWRDSKKYFLQNKFRQWMHKNVQKALNAINDKVTVNGVTYRLKYKESGPAYTLNISQMPGEKPFNLDVDLVPVIRFQYPRWPKGYKQMEGFQAKDWLLVPKPNKAFKDEEQKNRCWRLSFQEFEREMMKGCHQLKTTIRLVKKLRDVLGLKAIASYYIKTLFLWKLEQNDKKFWQNKLSFTFRIMVQDLRDAVKDKKIPYFWNKDHNLIEGLKPTLQQVYLNQLNDVVTAIEDNNVDKIVGALLNPDEMNVFKNSEFYQKQPANLVDSASVSRQISLSNSSSANVSRQSSTPSNGGKSSPDTSGNNITDHLIKQLLEKVEDLTSKNEGLTDKLSSLEDRVIRLERAAKENPVASNHLFEELLTPNSVSYPPGANNNMLIDLN